jgi:hypothetical protein
LRALPARSYAADVRKRVRRRVKPLPHSSYRGTPLPSPDGVFLPDSENLARIIAMRGATDEEIEAVYGLGTGTLKKWRKFYPGLDAAVESGRTKLDGEILFAMAKNALGYDYSEEQAVGGREPTVLSVRRHKPGEFAAQRHWLASRQRKHWPAREAVEVSGTGKNGALLVESRNELIDAILSLVTSRADPVAPKTKDARAS